MPFNYRGITSKYTTRIKISQLVIEPILILPKTPKTPKTPKFLHVTSVLKQSIITHLNGGLKRSNTSYFGSGTVF
jgi:hypothetical protein